MNLKPKFTATAIGSLPHTDPEKALDVILSAIPEAPIWPQLPKLGLREQMEIQYSEGLPRVVIEEAKDACISILPAITQRNWPSFTKAI